MKTLIIGGHTGGIGDAFYEYRRYVQLQYVDTYVPTIAEMNVKSPDSVDAYIGGNGPFDAIVYSAGISSLEWVSELTKEFDEVHAVNARGVVLVARAHTRSFPGHPVRYAVVVSDAAHTPMRGSISYTMSKAAAEMAVRNLGRELAPDWTVVGVSPGVVEGTDMTRELAEKIPGFRGWTPDQAREYEGVPPIGRRVTKREVAETLWFALTGPQALNGSIITINGGK